jgi:hypothetical protein
MQDHPATAWLGYVVPALVLGIILFLRVRSMRRVARLRLERLWIVPAIYFLITATVLHQSPPHGQQWFWVALALLAGAAIGWRRGALMRITIDPATHALNQQASPAAMLVIMVLIVVRQGLRLEAGALGFDAQFVTDLLVVLALGLFAATRAEMYLRARRMLRGSAAG